VKLFIRLDDDQVVRISLEQAMVLVWMGWLTAAY
jgi:hypothetical protein